MTATATIVALAVLIPTTPAPMESLTPQPTSQRVFLTQVKSAEKEIKAAPNSLALSEALATRDIQLATLRSVENWTGVVQGVQQMQGKGAISIDIGDIVVAAGVHLVFGLDTLVSPSEGPLYNSLLELKAGDMVYFSGNFLVHENSLVELSYTSSSATVNPRFLFKFTDLSRLPLPDGVRN